MYSGPTILRAARLLDVETGEMHRDAVIVVEDGLITAVNPASVPDMHDMDLGDVTLLPGLIDTHTHLTREVGADFFTDYVTRTEAYGAFNAVKYGGITVRAGFTTVRDYDGPVAVELGRAVERGDIVAPRVIPSRHPLGITGGHCDITGFAPGIREGGPEEGIANGPWEVVEAVRYQIKHGAKVIKTCATAGVMSLEGPVGAQQYTLEELTAMVEEAARHGIKVAAHAHGPEGILAAVQAGVASIEHGSILTDEIMDLMIEKGTYLVPTTYLVDRIALDQLPPLVRAKAEEITPLARRSLQRAIDARRPHRLRDGCGGVSARRERRRVRHLRRNGDERAGRPPHRDHPCRRPARHARPGPSGRGHARRHHRRARQSARRHRSDEGCALRDAGRAGGQACCGRARHALDGPVSR